MARKATATAATVKEIMTPDPVCISGDTSARELAHLLDTHGFSGVPVVDPLNREIGVVSKTDLVHRCVEGPLGSRPGTFFGSLADGLDVGTELVPDNLGRVEDFMSVEPITAAPDEPIGAVARRMAEEGVHRVVVVNEEQVVLGIVTSLDLLKAFPA